jgi:hypothetical protein
MTIKFKILFAIGGLLLLVGGMYGQKDDYALYYYVSSWIPALILGALIAWICGGDGIGMSETMYSGFCIVITVSFLFHRSNAYVIGRICAIIGATITYHLSKVKDEQ